MFLQNIRVAWIMSSPGPKSKSQQALIVPTEEQKGGFELGLTTKITSE